MELDVSKKVRTAIKAKLLELGVHVDEELPDYIMILIANRRSKDQMEEDLGLFLGDNTLKFTSWLHQVLKKLQEVTTSAPAATGKVTSSTSSTAVSVPSAKKPQAESPRSTEKIVETKAVSVKTAPVPKEVENKGSKRKKVEAEPVKEAQVDEEDSKSPKTKKLKISRQPVISPVRSEVMAKRLSPKETGESEVSHSVKPESFKKVKETPKKVQSSITVVNARPSRSKSPVNAPNSRRVEASRSPVSKKGRNSPVNVPSKRRYSSSQRDRSFSPSQGVKRNVRSSRKSRSRSRSGSPTTKARKSLRSLVAVVKRHNELNALKDEEYNPNRPQVSSTSIASVVHVTPRPKRTTKQEGGSNKLLFRALADAQKSIASHSANVKASSSVDKEKKVDVDNSGSSKIGVIPRKTSETSISKSARSEEREKTPKTELKTHKPSIKDRLGYRLATRVPISQRLAEAPRQQDLEAEEYTDEYDGDENYKSIIINVPISKDSKERSVHLEDEIKRSQGASLEEPKRLSIQVNVDSDETSSSEDELEIQPRPSEDLNLEPKDSQIENSTKGNGNSSPNKAGNSESEEEVKVDSVRNVESGKSTPNEENSGKDLPLDETSKHSEELEIEEYEEIEEEEDDEEYDVVIQERNIALPDPGEYDSGRVDKHEMEVENEIITMDTTDNKDSSNLPVDMEDGSRVYSPENVRYPLNLKSFNHGDTKFVVTMDGSDETYYSNEEIMETEGVPIRGPGDLRHRIGSRSVVTPKVYPTGFDPPISMPTFNQARPFLPITGAPRPFTGPLTTAVAAAASQCKYWPECTFKDKCIYPHPKCKFGENCTKPQCPYKHESSVFGNGNGNSAEAQGNTKTGSENSDGKILCKFFPKCHSMSCQFYHPSPCRFGIGCTDSKCKNFHPGQTVGQQRSKNKLFGAVTRPKSYRAPPPAAHLLRWKAPTSAVSVVTLEKKDDETLTSLADAPASTA